MEAGHRQNSRTVVDGDVLASTEFRTGSGAGKATLNFGEPQKPLSRKIQLLSCGRDRREASEAFPSAKFVWRYTDQEVRRTRGKGVFVGAVVHRARSFAILVLPSAT